MFFTEGQNFFCYRILQFSKTWKIIFFPESATVAKFFLKHTNIMSILAKRSSQASGDSLMYMGDRHLRQRNIIEDNWLFSANAFLFSLLAHACTLVILPLLFGCCMSYSRENPMPILLLETLFPRYDMSDFDIVFAPSKISGQTNFQYNRCSKSSRVSTRNGAMDLLVWNIIKMKMYFLKYFKCILRNWDNFSILGTGWSMFVHKTRSARKT